eukprot:1907811-Pleurochrysis_carterae.AAC.1
MSVHFQAPERQAPAALLVVARAEETIAQQSHSGQRTSRRRAGRGWRDQDRALRAREGGRSATHGFDVDARHMSHESGVATLRDSKRPMSDDPVGVQKRDGKTARSRKQMSLCKRHKHTADAVVAGA